MLRLPSRTGHGGNSMPIPLPTGTTSLSPARGGRHSPPMRRRSWLKLGIGSAVVLAVGGVAIALMAPGLRNGRLTSTSRAVVRAVAEAFLSAVLPTEPAARAAALDGLLARLDTLVAALPAHAQGELSQLLTLLATSVGRRTLAGLDAPWSEAPAAEVASALQSMRISSLTLRRQAYQALHDIVGAAYFTEESTWAMLGYPGPVAIP